MPYATGPSEYYTPAPIGPVVQAVVPASVHGLSATVAASGNTTSNIITADGYKLCTVAVMSTQAGTLTVKAYVDLAATIQRGSTVSTALTANTAGIADLSGLAPFQALVITISNSGGSTATLSNLLVLLQAA